MAKSQRKKTNRTRRSRQDGGAGSGWTMGGPLVPGLASDAMTREPYDACVSASRPGQISFSQAGGLPGMRGGAYTNNLSAPIAGFAQIDRDPSHCMPNHSNSLNNGRIQGGGAAVGPGGGSLLASAAPILEQHTARYTTAPSQWVGSTGAPVLLSQPLDGKMWSKACAQTGGNMLSKLPGQMDGTMMSKLSNQKGGNMLSKTCGQRGGNMLSKFPGQMDGTMMSKLSNQKGGNMLSKLSGQMGGKRKNKNKSRKNKSRKNKSNKSNKSNKN